MNGKFHPTHSLRIRNCLPILGKIETLLKQSVVWHIFYQQLWKKESFGISQKHRKITDRKLLVSFILLTCASR